MEAARILTTTDGVDVTEFDIGAFGNKQTDAVGANLLKQICTKLSSCIRRVTVTRSKENQAHRFLENETVTIDAINEGALRNANKACVGIRHALCVFDTVVSGYPTQPTHKKRFGATTHEDTQGFLLHGSLLMNAETKQVISVGHLNPWIRNITAESKSKDRLPEEKESFKWQRCVQDMISNLPSPERLTFVADREADIFSLLEYVTDQGRDFIIRAKHDRKLVSGDTISENFMDINKSFHKKIGLNRTRKRLKERDAILEVKYSQIEIKNTNKDGKDLQLYCVIAVETGNVPKSEDSVSWVLLTSHKITTDQQASQILDWYTWRWTIEEVHRIMKNKGLKIEDSQIKDPEKLLKLSMLLFTSAVRIMALVRSRNGNEQSAAGYFSESELIFMVIACLNLEGKTEKLKNRYAKGSMGWAAWVIARLGGWKGYDSESPPGPITMKIGLEQFQAMHKGWSLSNSP